MKDKPRILFLFSSSREGVLVKIARHEEPDTALRGQNHIPGADVISVGEYYRGIIPKQLYRRLPRFIKVFTLVPKLLRYDYIIASDELPLGYVISLCTHLYLGKAKWICLSMHSSVLIQRHNKHPLRTALLRKFWKSYFCIACLSRQQIKDLIAFGIPQKRLVFVPFGIDVDFFSTTPVLHNEELVVSVGRDKGRDYSTLIEVARSSPQHFVIVAGHENIPENILIPNNVSIYYDLSADQVRKLYAQARVIVVPSKKELTTSGSDCSGQTAILDAMAAGRPVVATRRLWLNDYFIAGQDLMVVEPENPKALSGAIESLWSDLQECQHLAVVGREKVTKQYTTHVLAKAFCRLIGI